MGNKLIIFVILILVSLPAFAQSVDTAWVRRYDGPGNGVDGASAVAVDVSGNVYVTGASEGSGTSLEGADYLTIRYDPNGNEVWVKRYNGQSDSTDYAKAVGVDASGYVYITGYSYGVTTAYDWVTTKYVQFLCGDTKGDGMRGNGDIVFLLNYLYRNGFTPDPWQAGDVNGDLTIDLGDVVHFINYLFKHGP